MNKLLLIIVFACAIAASAMWILTFTEFVKPWMYSVMQNGLRAGGFIGLYLMLNTGTTFYTAMRQWIMLSIAVVMVGSAFKTLHLPRADELTLIGFTCIAGT